MKKIIMTGASGYLGKKFISMYGNKLEVIAVVRDKAKLKDYLDSVEVLTLDEFLLLNRNFSDYYFLNLAFPRSSDFNLLTSSIDYTNKILFKALRLGLRKVINISSQSVYNIDRIDEANETDLVKVHSLYGMAKIYVEYQIEFLSKKWGFEFIHLRLSSVISRDFSERLVNRFIIKILKGDEVNAVEKGEKFSYVNIVDVSRAIYETIVNDNIKWNEIYNVGGPDEYTISEMLHIIENKLLKNGFKSKITITKHDDKLKRTKKISSEKFTSVSNWKPIYNIEKSIEEFL